MSFDTLLGAVGEGQRQGWWECIIHNAALVQLDSNNLDRYGQTKNNMIKHKTLTNTKS